MRRNGVVGCDILGAVAWAGNVSMRRNGVVGCDRRVFHTQQTPGTQRFLLPESAEFANPPL